jgi:hypothetical protein
MTTWGSVPVGGVGEYLCFCGLVGSLWRVATLVAPAGWPSCSVAPIMTSAC